MSRRWTRSVAEIGCLLLVSVLLVALPAGTAAASESCVERGTPYYWTHASCVEYTGPRVNEYDGTARVQLLTGFTRSNVERCTLYLQVKVTGSAVRDFEPYNCTEDARRGGVIAVIWHYGLGFQYGAAVTQYVWMDVLSKSGAKYYARNYNAALTYTASP